MFRSYLSPSSGGATVCIQQLVLIILCRWLSVVLVGFHSNQDKRQSSKKIINTNFCIHTVVLRLYYGCTTVVLRLYRLMIGLDTPETCRGWRNLLRISLHQFGFSLHNYMAMHAINKTQKNICTLFAGYIDMKRGVHYVWANRLNFYVIVYGEMKGHWNLTSHFAWSIIYYLSSTYFCTSRLNTFVIIQ